jgi:hypothetical protein
LLAVEETDLSIQLFDPTVPAALRLIGEGSPGSCLYFDLSQGDATLTGGLWVPLGMYGVGQVPVTSP